ncbi:transcriptional regulator [Paenibacillus sepulcri]|uniref:Transcriptional regulator n=1 Tax=Paenibacillus sepulcri TaxID=359917 RepID=A0ABS7CJU5_9BACL|nr:transcriptional regulator [Paenibacillus sepulcri]
MHKAAPESIPVWVVILAGCILLTQSLFLFTHARRHTKYYWVWGVVGLIQSPGPLIAYWLVHMYWPRIKERLKNRNNHRNKPNE